MVRDSGEAPIHTCMSLWCSGRALGWFLGCGGNDQGSGRGSWLTSVSAGSPSSKGNLIKEESDDGAVCRVTHSSEVCSTLNLKMEDKTFRCGVSASLERCLLPWADVRSRCPSWPSGWNVPNPVSALALCAFLKPLSAAGPPRASCWGFVWKSPLISALVL